MELWRTLKSLRLGKFLCLVKIWAEKFGVRLLFGIGRILQLLTSSWSGWRALVQILVDMLPLRHVDLKWSEGSGRPAFMVGVSPELYRLVVPARPVKISAGVQNLGGYTEFRRPVKFRCTIELWRALKPLGLGKISATSQNLSRKVWRPRQNLQLLTSSWSGWRALVQILVDVLPFRHVPTQFEELIFTP